MYETCIVEVPETFDLATVVGGVARGWLALLRVDLQEAWSRPDQSAADFLHSASVIPNIE
jgi:hypothetical protein